jgi:hypothetical protein
MKKTVFISLALITSLNSFADPLEDRIASGTTWNRVSADAENADVIGCPDIMRFMAIPAGNEILSNGRPENEDHRPGDLNLFMQQVEVLADGRERTRIVGESMAYRPNAPQGRTTLGDASGFVLGWAGSRSTITERPDRSIIEHRGRALTLIMSGSMERKITYHKSTGVIEIQEKVTGLPELNCRYEVAVTAQQPAGADNTDRGLNPKGDSPQVPASGNQGEQGSEM